LRNGTLTFDPEGAAPLLMEMANHVYEGAPGPIKSEDMQQGTDVMDDATDALRYCIVSITGLRAAEQPVDFYTAQRAMKTARLLEVA
jgi:hypothetical protein